MMTDLERRRRAIADALRAVMAEPDPRPTQGRIDQRPVTVQTPTAPTLPRLPASSPMPAAGRPLDARSSRGIAVPPSISELLSVRGALSAHIDWDELEDSDNVDSPAVPPLESAGSMSRAASVALFGHA